MIELERLAADATIGAGVGTAPLWLPLLERGAHWYLVAAAVLLVTLRILIACRVLRRPRRRGRGLS